MFLVFLFFLFFVLCRAEARPQEVLMAFVAAGSTAVHYVEHGATAPTAPGPSSPCTASPLITA